MPIDLPSGVKLPCKLKFGWFWAFLNRYENEGSVKGQSIQALVAARGPVLSHKLVGPDVNVKVKLLDYKSPAWACTHLRADDSNHSSDVGQTPHDEKFSANGSVWSEPGVLYPSDEDEVDLVKNAKPLPSRSWEVEDGVIGGVGEKSRGEKNPQQSHTSTATRAFEPKIEVTDSETGNKLIDRLARQTFEFTTFESSATPTIL